MSTDPVIPESLYDLVLVEDPQFSPDGKMLVYVCSQADRAMNGYRRRLCMVPVDGSAPARVLTNGPSDFSPRFSPDGSQICFVSARGGSAQLYCLPTYGGEARQMTWMPGGASQPCWSPDGRWIAFSSASTLAEHGLENSGQLFEPALRGEGLTWAKQEREALRDPRVITRLPYRTGTDFFDGRYRHVYVLAAEGGAPRRLSNGNFHHAAPHWTPDSRMVVTNSNRDQSSGEEFFELWSTILAFDINSGEEKVLQAEVCEEGRTALVSPDGRWVAHSYIPKVPVPYTEPYYAAVSSLETGEMTILSAPADLTVIDFDWSADSRALVCLIHDHGDGKLVNLCLPDGKVEPLVEGHRMIQDFAISPDGKYLAYTASSPTHPGDLYIMDLPEKNERQITAYNQEWEANHFLSTPHEIRYQGEGGVEVQGWYFYPKGFDPKKKYPLAVEIHGGPQIMWGNSFWHEFQVLCSRGYFVFFCNPRGSSGYGAEFQRLRGQGGYTDMPDIMTGLDQVLSREQSADPDRLVVTGGSYGGFLTGWIVGHTDRFKAAVSQRGVYDEFNMFGSGDIPESVEWDHNGIPRPETLAHLWEYSPAAYAAQVVTPLKILHSELDYRVPVSQAETFFAMLRRHGNRDAVMVRFPREGHELSRSGEPVHRVRRLYEIVTWFDRYVLPERLSPRPLCAPEIQENLESLPGWQEKAGKLARSVDCGNFHIAVNWVNRLEKLVKPDGVQPEISIQGGVVTICLGNGKPDGITDWDADLARTLQNEMIQDM